MGREIQPGLILAEPSYSQFLVVTLYRCGQGALASTTEKHDLVSRLLERHVNSRP